MIAVERWPFGIVAVVLFVAVLAWIVWDTPDA